ncbi:MAG: T9SS type A sorting domain-containing protein [Bacteroidales bacterium]|nr:T9SS type A sorting domain-containing protein [Bacteroidales bacterium]
MRKTVLLKRLVLWGCIMFFVMLSAKAQLSAGSIAFTAFNADGDDDFAIVALTDIPANTTIYFSDNEPNADGSSFLDFSEGTIQWNTGESIIISGTIIFFTDIDNEGNPNFGVSIGILSDATFDAGLNLSANGDALYAVMGTVSDNELTITSWLAGIQNATNNEGDNFSQTGLVKGVTFIEFFKTTSPDGGFYNDSRSGENLYSNYLAQLANSAKWVEYTTNGESILPIITTPFRVDNNWLGSSGTDWETSGNWSNGIPTENHDITIPTGLSNNPIISTTTGANGYDLNIEETATLTLVSDATNSASLIFGGTYTGSSTVVTYQRYMSGTDWHMMGSPFTGQTINAAFLTANSIIGMKDYNETADNWNTDYTISDPNTAFALGKAYAIKRNSNGVVNLTGTINNAAVDITLTRDNFGWNLLCNPFSSAINATLSAHATNNLITANADVLDPSYAALYIWDQASSSYKIINNAGNGSLVQNYLQVGQGFFVKSKSGGGTFNITPAMQSHQTNAAFKSTDKEEWAAILLHAETDQTQAKTQILFGENMHRGLDIGYDAGLFNSNPDFSLYSHLIEDNGVDFGLQCLPVDFENLVIPIGLDAKAGNIIVFSAASLNIPEEYAVVLEDKTEATFTNLTEENANYSIQLSEDSKGIGRFFIHTSFKSTLGFDDLIPKNTFQIFSQANNNQLIIRGNVRSTTRARIYTTTGKLVAVIHLNLSSENLIPFNQQSGIYIIQISNELGTQTQKFAWIK